MKTAYLLFIFFFFGTACVFADAANHLVISEVVYGNSNASDEFVELYNPTDQAINLETYGLKLHIRNSNGSSDTNKTITWVRNTIPAHGFFLFVASASTSYAAQADATYSAGLVAEGAVYISLASGARQNVVDFIAWGSHTMPAGFETQKTTAFNSGQSIERKSDPQGIITTNGNAWDTDGDDFLTHAIPESQNSQSAVEAPVTDIIPPAEVSSLSAENITTTSAELRWMNPIDADFSSIVLQKTGEAPANLGNVQLIALTNLLPQTSYEYTVFTVDVTGNVSAGTLIQFQTAALPPPPDPNPDPVPDPIADTTPPGQVQNLRSGTITDTSVQILWDNPSDADFSEVFLQINADQATTLGLISSYTASNLQANTAYLFTVFTEDTAHNRSAGIPLTVTTLIPPDIVAPQEVQNLQLGTASLTTIQMQWANPVDADFSHLLFSSAHSGDALSNPQNIATATTWTLENLSPNTAYTVKLQSVDQTGNTSLGVQSIFSTLSCHPENNTVIINEIAWPGTTLVAGQSDVQVYGHQYQWIELYNSGENPVLLNGYKITSAQGLEILLDNLTIDARGFLLLQNTESDLFSGDTLVPDLSFTNPQDEQGHDILLTDTTTDMYLQNQCGDILENISKIFMGNYASYRSMARRSPDLPANNKNSWFHEQINGSPRAENIFYSTNLSIAYIWPQPFHPRPGQSFSLGIDVSNLSQNPAPANSWGINILDAQNQIITQNDGMLLQNYADFFIVPVPMVGLDTGILPIKSKITCGASTCGMFASLNGSIDVQIAPWISEVFPSPKSGGKEWIEIENPLDTEFLALGSLICIEHGACITLKNNIPAHSFVVIEDGDTTQYSGNWLSLPPSAILFWKRPIDEFSDTVYDRFAYENASSATTFARDETSGAITASPHQTKGENNSTNHLPQAIITIQGTGNSSGSTPFYFNPTGENSTDSDGDALIFAWDFGNGQTSTLENPDGLYFSTAGTFLVTLTVNDGHGGIGTTQQTVTVATSSGGGSSTSSSSNTKTNTPKISFNVTSTTANSSIFLSKISANDSQEDWIEIFCKDCTNPVSLAGYQLLDDAVFFTFPSTATITAQNPVVVRLAEHIRSSNDPNSFITEKKQGLTKTDEQLLLLTPQNALADAVCWNNQDGKLTTKEADAENQLRSLGQWSGDCVSSVGLEKKDTVMVRDSLQADTNTLNEWFILQGAEAKEEVKKPITASGVEIFIASLDIKNTQTDSVTLFCQHCDQDLFGLGIALGTSDIFSFPKDSFVASGQWFRVVFGAESPDSVSSVSQDTALPSSLTSTPLPEGEGLKKSPFSLWEKGLGDEGVTAKEGLTNKNIPTFYAPQHSLVGTDSALSLKDTENSVEDFVCWSDRKGTEKRQSDLASPLASLLEKRLEQKLWKGNCLDSTLLEKNDLFVREKFETHENELSLFTHTKAIKQDNEPIFLFGLSMNEVIPNPFGNDAKFEWIELKNDLNTPINTHGWTLHSGSKSYEFPSQEMLPNAFLLLPSFVSHISFKNQNGEITLTNPETTTMQTITYAKTFEGASFARNTQGDFVWTRVKTPMKDNVFLPLQKKLKDSDHDGLDDEFETLIGTNPKNRDTDGDKCPDGFEFEHNMDPLLFDDNAESVFKTAILSGLSQKVAIPKKENDLLKIAGATEPFAKITLFVHSTPQTFIAQADAKGQWEVAPAVLEAGSHFFQTQINDLSGVVTDLSAPITFTLSHDYQKPVIQKAEKKQSTSKKSTSQLQKNTVIASQEKLYKSEVQKPFVDPSPLREIMQKQVFSQHISYRWYALFACILLGLGWGSFKIKDRMDDKDALLVRQTDEE